MKVKAIKTCLMRLPKDDLFEVIDKYIKHLPDRSIVVVASKVVSLHQGRCILKSKVLHKDELIKKEADRYLPREMTPNRAAVLTIKNNILIPTAGIDESNADGYYVLWPKRPDKAAREIHNFLRRKYKTKNFGVLIIDSHTVPLRRGVMGVALGYFGFVPIRDYRGQKDLFGRKFKMSTVDVADCLASAAMLVMGEGSECRPLALIEEVPFIQFTAKPYRPEKRRSSLEIHWKEDLYGPLLRSVKWQKK